MGKQEKNGDYRLQYTMGMEPKRVNEIDLNEKDCALVFREDGSVSLLAPGEIDKNGGWNTLDDYPTTLSYAVLLALANNTFVDMVLQNFSVHYKNIHDRYRSMH